jgi:hypothetical protein
MGAGLVVVKSGFILFIKNYQFPLQINTLEREREREYWCDERLKTKNDESVRLAEERPCCLL